VSDAWVGRLAAAAVLLVAAIAAVVSYVHIETLATIDHQSWLAAVLLPLSVDGTVAAASLQMLGAARAGVTAGWLPQAMLTCGVAATLAANVLYGWPHGVVAAAVSGWPAVAFIGSAEMAIQGIRRARPSPAGGRTESPAGRAPGRARDRSPDRAAGGQGKRSPEDIAAAVAALAAAEPGITGAAAGRRLGLSARTARRYLGRAAGEQDNAAA